MSSTYTADKTLAESPSAVPSPATVPVLTLPSDGDADNAASVAQAFKALANEIAWLKFPQAELSVWLEAIRVHYNARGFRRAYTSHMGNRLIAGIEWDQDWDLLGGGFDWSSGPVNPWAAVVTGTGTVRTRAPSISAPVAALYPTIKISPPTGTAGTACIYRNGTCVPSDDLGLEMKWAAALDTIGSNRTTVLMGLIDLTAASTSPTIPHWGAWFSKAAGDTHWQANVTGLSPIDTGVTPVANAFNDFKIEIHGANISDTSAGIIKFFIDGNEVASFSTVISALPSTTDPITPVFGTLTTSTGGAAVALYVGPVKGRHNTAVNAL